MSQFRINCCGNGKKKAMPTKVVGRFLTNTRETKPNADIIIRTDDGCKGHIMSLLPGNSNLFKAVPEWQSKGLRFFITDLETVFELDKQGTPLRKSEVAPVLLEDTHVRDIVFRAERAFQHK